MITKRKSKVIHLQRDDGTVACQVISPRRKTNSWNKTLNVNQVTCNKCLITLYCKILKREV